MKRGPADPAGFHQAPVTPKVGNVREHVLNSKTFKTPLLCIASSPPLPPAGAVWCGSLSAWGRATIFGLPSCFRFSPERVLHLGNDSRCDNGNRLPPATLQPKHPERRFQNSSPHVCSRTGAPENAGLCLRHCLWPALIISDKRSWPSLSPSTAPRSGVLSILYQRRSAGKGGFDGG